MRSSTFRFTAGLAWLASWGALTACSGDESVVPVGGGGSLPTACSPDGTVAYCYPGPDAARSIGECKDGTHTCVAGAWEECVGYVLPVDEICDDYLDNNCNGVGDEGCACSEGAIRPCYTGPATTRLVGMCTDGEQACINGTWDATCQGQVLPAADEPCNEVDDNCNGAVDEGCSCTEGATRACYSGSPATQHLGICQDGTQSCVDGTWEATCEGEITPSPELCNGEDDDCDGQADEDLGETTCGLGPCEHTVQNCVNHVPQTCDPMQGATTETCDGGDNDCDGQVDEGCSCVDGSTQPCYTGSPSSSQNNPPCHPGTQTCASGAWGSCTGQQTPTTEVCNGVDDDCDATVDDGLGSTSCGLGPCYHTQQNCVGGQPQACDPYLGATTETCNGIDDNCNGTTDDGLGTTYCGVGQCYHGQQNCVGGVPVSCNPMQGATTETCDGVDNDCDGSTDEGNPGGGGACTTGQYGICSAGTYTCQGGSLVCVRNQNPTTETCNGLDDDCDNQVDEGLGTTYCGLGACYHGQPNCVNGSPVSCNPMQGSTSETCDSVDNDCDGTVDDGTNLQLCGDINYECIGGYCQSATCPFVYTWDGAEFEFEAEIHTSGKLGVKRATGFAMPQPNDYLVLANDPVEVEGSLELRIVEERTEVDYTDLIELVAADVPQGLAVYVQRYGLNTPYDPLEVAIHTVDEMLTPPVSAVHVNSGTDILTEISATDEVYAVLNEDRNIDYDYQTIEIDPGDISAAPQVKLIIDGRTAFPNSAAGVARKALFGPTSRLQVVGPTGTWVTVPSSVAYLSPPAEARRPFVVDITNIFQSPDRRVRITYLFKTYIDGIFVDTTPDVPPELTTTVLESADLHWYGYSQRTGGELFDYVYGSVNQTHWPGFPGFYTRYGDVTELLTAMDDKFVIYWGGDEITLRFTPFAPVAAGMTRFYVVHGYGYYKEPSSSVPLTVEPLPFQAMSGYPYDLLDEHYPDDPDHVAYRQSYNTRWLP